MQISFFVPRCKPDNSHGRYVIELSKRLSAENEVRVYTGAMWAPLESMVEPVIVPILNRPTIARLGLLWAVSLAIAKRGSSEIVHIQGADAPVGNVLTAHCCNAAMQAAANGGGTVLRKLNYSIGIAAEKHCFTKPSVRAVIAVSNKVRAEIQEYYNVGPDKITVIPHGVDSEVFHPRNRVRARSQVRFGQGFGPEDFVVLFVGGDYRIKGLMPLLKAAAQVPRVKILAAGLVTESRLANYLRQTGLTHRVVMAGVANDMSSLYAAADCFALPTRYDTFSLSTLEAMASGLPVIVSRDAGVTELLTSGLDSSVIEDPDDVDELATSLRGLAEDAELRERMSIEARRTAEQHTWDEVVRRTMDVYHGAVTSGA